MNENLPAEKPDKNQVERDRRNPLQPEIVDQFLKLQHRELELRASEQQRGSRQDEHNFELAKRSIEAQATDVESHRNHEARMYILDFVKWGSLIALFVALFVFLVVVGQVDLAKQIAGYFAALSAGAFGGFHYGRQKGREDSGTHEE